MAENLPITILGESEAVTEDDYAGTKIIGLELNVLGKPVHLRVGVADQQARLADIVPLSRVLSTKLALAVLDRLRQDGKFVPCCKGCSACCSYVTPLSVPEVFRLRQEVLAMPADDARAVMESCLDTAKKILDNWPRNFDINESTKMNAQTQVSRLGRWYAALKLPCPFLSDGLCSRYEQRPTACREYIVTGSASLCHTEGTDESRAVQMPVSILEALAQLTADLEQSSIEAVMLPLALPWAQENSQRDRKTWPAAMMVKRFVEIVKTMSQENLEPPV